MTSPRVKMQLSVYIILMTTWMLFGQEKDVLTLESCYQLAEENHPLQRHFATSESMAAIQIDNLEKDIKPKLRLFGQASYQTHVTQIPIDLPGGDIPEINKDQYRMYGEVVHALSDYGRNSKRKEIVQAQSLIDHHQIGVQLYQVRSKLNEFYFGVILTDRQIEVLEFMIEDIDAGLARLQVAIENGTAIESDADQLLVKRLEVDQEIVALLEYRKMFVGSIESLIGRRIPIEVKFQMPDSLSAPTQVDRPELALFKAESDKIGLEKDLLVYRGKPNFAGFIQAGIGRPGLNFLDPSLQSYAIGGLRLNWSFNDLFRRSNDNQLLSLKQQRLEVNRATFLLNTKIEMDRLQHEFESLHKKIKMDRNIIEIRSRIKETSKTQLENGIITSAEYIAQVNDENRARLDLHRHQIELLKSQYQLKTISGN